MTQSNIKGFTLIELMIALTLGLILVAVAIQLLISGQVNYRIQQAASTVQDSGVFSLNSVTKSMRLANHGNAGALNDETLYGGVVLSSQTTTGKGTATSAGNLNGLKSGTTLIQGDGYISKNAFTDSAFGSIKSDQLVIMYQAPIDMVTCTGKKVKGPNRSLTSLTKGWYVVEKYYIKKSSSADQSDLYCSDSLFIAKSETVPQTVGTGTTAVTISTAEQINANYGTADGQMIAQNVEYMRVQLLVRNADKTTATMGINDYTGLSITDTLTHRPAVIGINMGWLVRSNETVPNLETTTYKVLDQSLTAPNDKYMRYVYSTTVAIRNGGLGDIIQ